MRVFALLAGLLLGTLVHAQAPEPNAEAKPGMEKRLDKLTFAKRKAKLPYRLMRPEGYVKDGKDRFPLVVFLHGIGERGSDNAKQLINGVEQFATDSARKKHPCFLAVPQCPEDKLWVDLRNTWTNHTLAARPTEPAALVFDLIDALCKEHPIDVDRVYLTGVSIGGYGVWDLICRKPEQFAAAIAVCGGGDPSQAEKLIRFPIWAFHGAKDNLVFAERSRDMVAAIRKAGGRPVYTEFEEVGHDAWTPTFKNSAVMDWLFAHKRAK